ncbi:MAG: hypothetical protein JXA96_13135 [Sedimentisphaerales bacterium]|nr:hypothetical protein [Sedimentisphaerales bacterium]
MNKHKLRQITNYIQGFGRLPTDQWGQVLSIDQLMTYFGLDDCLDSYEQAFMKMEFAAMIEADQFMDRFRLRKI